MTEWFAAHAARLAGSAGVVFGWTPEVFWHATPSELAVLVNAVAGEAGPPPADRATILQLMEDHPDG